MREIKFRVFKEYEPKIVEGSQRGWMNYYDFLLTNDVKRFARCGWYIKDVMQYTGLKDKNGTEIYEGDCFSMGQRLGDGSVSRIGVAVAAVTWNERELCFILEDTMDNTEFNIHWFVKDKTINKAIIGNIYENPELLAK